MHRKVFEDFIKNSRIDRNNLMCYIIAHDEQQPTYMLMIKYVVDVDQYIILQQ